jgi:type VI secretion system protein ImpF
MADRGAGDILRPSIIDRLSGRPGGSQGGQFQPIGVRELKQAVARDLEWLLNTRVWLPQTPEEIEDLVEGRESLLCYGIPDLSIFSWASPADCQRIAALVEQTIRSFEPRLLPRSVRCEILPAADASDFNLKIRIEAILYVDPISEHVSFDTKADFDGGGIRIETFE